MKNGGVVFVSGCYDILHGGHVEFLVSAKALGQKLIVCVPTDEVFTAHKQRKPALPLEHRVELVRALRVVNEVVVGSDPDLGLNFKTQFLTLKPDFLVVTDDDQFSEAKRALCATVGAQYVQLPKTLSYAQISSTEISRYMRAPLEVPLRVDFAGGWLDVPKHAVQGAYVVNCAISPLVSLSHWPYHIGGGLGGSAAYRFLTGANSLEEELKAGVGWQDPAIIAETGLCAWKSGPRPRLAIKTTGEMLQERMGIVWTGRPHSTPNLVDTKRNYGLIADAGQLAFESFRSDRFYLLAQAVMLSYQAQLHEGMPPLPEIDGSMAYKYLGSGWGGYALYLFETGTRPENVIPVEPYTRY